MQGEDAFILCLGRTGKPLSWEASVKVWLELRPPASTAQVDSLGSSSTQLHSSGVNLEFTDGTPLVTAAGTATGSLLLLLLSSLFAAGTVSVAKAAFTFLILYPVALRNLHYVMPGQMHWSALALSLRRPP